MPKKEVTLMQPYILLAPKTVPYYFELTFSTFLLKCLNSGTEKSMILQTSHTFFSPLFFIIFPLLSIWQKSYSGLSSRTNIYFSGQLFSTRTQLYLPVSKADVPLLLLSFVRSLYKSGYWTYNNTVMLFVSLFFLAVCS